MCGIAEVMSNLGYTVSGSDIEPSPVTDRLESLGIRFFSTHHERNIEDSDVVVTSSAISPDNVEVQAAHAMYKPVVPRAEMLGELMRQRYGIAVAGTHGKTTTTSFITDIFQAASIDPTYVIGGLLRSENRNARLGSSRYLIAEADESDASFLYLQPMLAVVTNIDYDHLATYDHEFGNLRQAFREFVSKLPFYGAVILCIDDPELRVLANEVSRPVLTYGLAEDADYQALNIEIDGVNWRFDVKRPGQSELLSLEIKLPGIQNIQNALAAVAVATDEGIADSFIQAGIKQSIGVTRRFEVSTVAIRDMQLPLVDDYGHHPTELICTLETVKQVWPDRQSLMVYQPHRFTRTRDLFTEFVDVLSGVDDLVILDTYAASEMPIEGASAHALCQSIKQKTGRKVELISLAEDAKSWLVERARDNHVIMVQGAGDVSAVSAMLKSV